MDAKITLSRPTSVDDLRAAYPRALLASEDDELELWLDIAEHALRSHFHVTELSSDIDDALGRAIIAAWPSLQQQVRQIAQESASPDGHSVSYARGEESFNFPPFLSVMLGAYGPGDAPTTTELVR